MGTDSTSWRTSWYIAVFPSNFGVSGITPRSIRGTSLWVATHVGVILAINYILRNPPVTVGTLWGPTLTSAARLGGVDNTSIANTDIVKTICGKHMIRLYISVFRVSLHGGNYILSNSQAVVLTGNWRSKTETEVCHTGWSSLIIYPKDQPTL